MNELSNWQELEQRVSAAVKLERRPVAVAFLDAVPTGVERFEGAEPSGCSFWRLAADGRVFYTVLENHFHFAVGAYTHNIALSPEREKETEIGYHERQRRAERLREDPPLATRNTLISQLATYEGEARCAYTFFCSIFFAITEWQGQRKSRRWL